MAMGDVGVLLMNQIFPCAPRRSEWDAQNDYRLLGGFAGTCKISGG